jgi:Alpha-L-fucosidase
MVIAQMRGTVSCSSTQDPNRGEVLMGMTTTGPSKRPLPRWFDEAKFGILVVWTPAAVPAFVPLPRGENWEDTNKKLGYWTARPLG